MASRTFLDDLVRRAQNPEPRLAGRITSLNEAWLLIGDATVKLREEIDKPVGQRTHLAIRRQLVELGALTWRVAGDLGLEYVSEAAGQDIPF